MILNNRKLAAVMALMMMGTALPALAEMPEVPEETQEVQEMPGEKREGRGERPEGMQFGKHGKTDETEQQEAAETEEAADEPEENGAETLDFDAVVESTSATAVISPIGGRVESVPVRAGSLVKAGDVLAVLETAKVYAPQSGTISAVFGEAGDSVSNVCDQYGAVLSMEPETGRYTISASTENAYSNSDNLLIHVGEHVYLKCYSDGDHTGEGFVSAVSGSNYTVIVTTGEFKVGETVSVFRRSGYTSASRLGRGDCQRGNDVTIGSAANGGSIVKMHVQPGDVVQKGDLLYETVSGSYPAYYCTGAEIRASAGGILSELKLSAGENVNADSVVASIEPMASMQLRLDVIEADLPFIAEGDKAEIRLNWDDGAVRYTGTVAFVSRTAQESGAGQSSGEAMYTAYVEFVPDENVRLGMTGTCTITHTK